MFVRLFSSYTRHETDGESNDKKYAHGGNVVSDTTVSYVDVFSIGEQKGKRKTKLSSLSNDGFRSDIEI